MESSVKVGVRIRPLVPKETLQGNKSIVFGQGGNSVSCRGNTFTYDYIFGPEYSQQKLYEETAAPMMSSFLDGYNVTIMAYGQTGSGKSYTMGSVEGDGAEVNQGIIPRFVADLFVNLDYDGFGKEFCETSKSSMKVSFLEIYGEDIYDLLSDLSFNSNGRLISGNVNDITKIGSERANNPLFVRENDQGKVFVQGLNEVNVQNCEHVMQLLWSGSKNRRCAATNMNAGSSRSHAVFTIHLKQSIRNKNEENPQDYFESKVMSKLTFVDLAGSERIKKTGAEGQRMKEGIQINSGLFNLGQVINALADEQRIKSGIKSQHIPYRNSKLTLILKDALGGNSQTLFLACVSPTEASEFESYSTLQYAKQARNIKNKPVKYMDKHQLELHKLKCTANYWMNLALEKVMKQKDGLSCSITDSLDMDYVNLVIKRDDAQEFLKSMEKHIEDGMIAPTNCIIEKTVSRPVRLSVAAPIFSPCKPAKACDRTPVFARHPMELESSIDVFKDNHCERGRRNSIITSEMITAVHNSVSVEETEKLLKRMMNLVMEEKKHTQDQNGIIGAETYFESEDDLVDKESKSDDIASPVHIANFSVIPESPEVTENDQMNELNNIHKIDAEIQEKEQILCKLMEAMKGFATMKSEYERLLESINTLETEKMQLEEELERHAQQLQKASDDKSANLSIEKMRERYNKIKEELQSMKHDQKRKQGAYALIQKESKQCEMLQSELRKIKESRIQLLKSQKDQAAVYQKFKKEQLAKFNTIKKMDVKKTRMINDMKTEVTKRDRILGHKEREIGRANAKLKACEDHINQLLKIQNRMRNNTITKGASKPSAQNQNSFDNEHLISSKEMIISYLDDEVERRHLNAQYESLCKQKETINEKLVENISNLDAIYEKVKLLPESERENAQNGLEAAENLVYQLSKDHDLITSDIASLQEQLNSMVNKNVTSNWEEVCKEILVSLSARQQEILIWELLQEKVNLLSDKNSSRLKLIDANSIISQKEQIICEKSEDLESLKRIHARQIQEFEMERVNSILAICRASPEAKSEVEDTKLQSAVMQKMFELEGQLEKSLQSYSTLEQQKEEILLKLTELQLTMSPPTSEDIDVYQNAWQKISNLWIKVGVTSEDRILTAQSIMKDDMKRRETVYSQLHEYSESISQELFLYQDSIQAILTLWTESNCSIVDLFNRVYGYLKKESISEFNICSYEDTVKLPLLMQLEIYKQIWDPFVRIIYDNMGMKFNAKDELVLRDSSLENTWLLSKDNQKMVLEPAYCFIQFFQDVLEPLVSLINEISFSSSNKLKDFADGAREINCMIQDNSISGLLSAFSSDDIDCLNELFVLMSKDGKNEARFQFCDLDAIVKALLKHFKTNSILFTNSSLLKWKGEIRRLTVAKAQLKMKCIGLAEECSIMMNELGILSKKELSAFLGQADPTIAKYITESLTSQHFNFSAISAAPALLNCLSELKFGLDSVKINRIAIATNLSKFINSFSVYFRVENVSELPDDIPYLHQFTASPSDSVFFDQSSILNLAQSFSSLTGVLNSENMEYFDSALNVRLTYLFNNAKVHMIDNEEETWVLSQLKRIYGSIDNEILLLSSDNISVYESIVSKLSIDSDLQGGQPVEIDALQNKCLEFYHDLHSSYDNLYQAVAFMTDEESWLRDTLSPILDHWDDNISSKNQCWGKLFKSCIAYRWIISFNNIIRGIQEVYKIDSMLNKHVIDMEEFETQSKANRSKLLAGNSKALMDEEKFRKQGKKKYEAYADKLVNSLQLLQAYCKGNKGIGCIQLEAANLSQSTMDLLSGANLNGSSGEEPSAIVQEKTELMHLHSVTQLAQNRKLFNQKEVLILGGENDSLPAKASRGSQGQANSRRNSSLSSRRASNDEMNNGVRGVLSESNWVSPTKKPEKSENLGKTVNPFLALTTELEINPLVLENNSENIVKESSVLVTTAAKQATQPNMVKSKLPAKKPIAISNASVGGTVKSSTIRNPR